MTTEIVPISVFQLLICVLFIIFAGISSIKLHLGLERDIFWGTVRTFCQLYLMGFILIYVFRLENPVLIILLYAGMIFFAAWTIKSRVKEKVLPVFVPTLVTMMFSYMLVTFIVTALVVQAKPWYKAQYFIPLGGMVIGNSMTAIAIALDRLFSELRKRRKEVELMLCLGATYQEATQNILKNSIKAGMIPSINSMMAVGVVFIPGMMTGQILAGVDPMISIKYQIVVMLMLVGSTALGSILTVYFERRLCFTKAHQLKL